MTQMLQLHVRFIHKNIKPDIKIFAKITKRQQLKAVNINYIYIFRYFLSFFPVWGGRGGRQRGKTVDLKSVRITLRTCNSVRLWRNFKVHSKNINIGAKLHMLAVLHLRQICQNFKNILKTFEPKILYKNKDIRPEPKFRRPYKSSSFFCEIANRTCRHKVNKSLA